MNVVKIEKKAFPAGLATIAKSFRLFGPMTEGKTSRFIPLDGDQQPDLNYINSHLSPKSMVYPQSTVLFTYTFDPTANDAPNLKEAAMDHAPKAIIGLRPCDAKALTLLNLNFDTPALKDPYWTAAYASTLLVGLACTAPSSTCFCTSCDCGPFHTEGLDVLLVDDGSHYIAVSHSPAGEAFLQNAGWDEKIPPNEAEERITALKTSAEAKIVSTVETDRLKSHKMLDLYQAPFWDEIAFACINCGACTFSCPTCWCFDIQDEVIGTDGVRQRNWDTCMAPLFTLHASGHNPRGKKIERLRQRFMHKLKYFVDKYDKGIMCVGCGRCVNQCPVNIDIRSISNLMNAYSPA